MPQLSRDSLQQITDLEPDADIRKRRKLVSLVLAASRDEDFELCLGIIRANLVAEPSDERTDGIWVTAFAAAVTICGRQGSLAASLIREAVLPLLSSTNTAVLPWAQQVAEQAAELVTATQQQHALAHDLLAAAASALLPNGHSSSAATSTTSPTVPAGAVTGATMPQHTAGLLAVALVARLSSLAAAAPDQGAPQLLPAAVGMLLQPSLQLLCSSTAAERKLAVQALLPALLQCSQHLGPDGYVAAEEQAWDKCSTLLLGGGAGCRAALAALVRCPSLWRGGLPQCEPAAATGGQEGEALWGALRKCLVDEEQLGRKRALALLQRLLDSEGLAGGPPWSLWLVVFQGLDDFAAHLVAPTWSHIAALHPTASLPGSSDGVAAATTGVPQTTRSGQAAKRARGSKRGSAKAKGDGSVAEAAGVPGQAEMAFSWMAVLWQRALQHENLQVQKLAMRTLLQRDWSPSWAAQVPASFLLEVFLPALAAPINYRNQQGFSLMEAASEFLQQWLRAQGPEAHRQLLAGAAAFLATAKFTRAGLQGCLHTVVDAAEACARPFADGPAEQWTVAMLHDLRACLVLFTAHHGTAYRAANCRGALRLAAVVAPPGSCPVATAGRVLCELPLAMLLPGGDLHDAVRAWLLGTSTLPGASTTSSAAGSSTSSSTREAAASTCSAAQASERVPDEQTSQAGSSAPLVAPATSPAAATASAAAAAAGTAVPAGAQAARGAAVAWLEEGLKQMLERYYAAASAGAVREGPSPLQLQAWEADAQTWALLMAVVGRDCGALLPRAASVLADQVQQLYRRPYLPPGTAERTLLLLHQILLVVTFPTLQPPDQSSGPTTSTNSSPTSNSRPSTSTSATSNKQPSSASSNGAPASEASTEGTGIAALEVAVRQLLRATAEDLASYVLSALEAAWDPGSSLEGHAGAASRPAAQANSGPEAVLPPKLHTAAVRAMRAVHCCALGVQLLSADASTPGQRALERLVAAAVKLPNMLATKGVPNVPGQPNTSIRLLDFILQGLAATANSLAIALQHVPQQVSQQVLRSFRLQPLLQAAFFMRFGGAPGSRGTDDDAGRQLLADSQWPCLDALLFLASRLPAVAGTHSSITSLGAMNGEQLGQLLAEALAAARAALKEQLLPVLRCIKQLWAAVLLQPASVQVALAEKLGLTVDTSAAGLQDTSPVPVDTAAAGSHAGSTGSSTAANATRPSASGTQSSSRAPQQAAQQQQQQQEESSSSPAAVAVLLAEVGDAVYSALVDLRKRRPALCAAAVAVLLHPALFSAQATTHLAVIHREGGAMRALLRRLMRFGARSPRVMLLVALHLASLLAANPRLVGLYQQELVDLLLFGVSSNATMGVELEGVQDPLEVRELAGVPPAPDAPLAEQYHATDLAPRIVVACALYRLASVAGLTEDGNCDATGGHPYSAEELQEGIEGGRQLWRRLVEMGLHDPAMSTDNFRAGSDLHRQKIRLWQAAVVAASFVTGEADVRWAVEGVLGVLPHNNPTSVKQYQEALCAALLLRHPALVEALLLPLLTNYERTHVGVASTLLVAAQVALHCEPGLQRQLLPRVVLAMVPWVCCHTHNIRTFAQLLLFSFTQRFPLHQDPWPTSPGDQALLQQMLCYFEVNHDMLRLRRTMGDVMHAWSPAHLTSPRRVFISGVHLAGMADEVVTFEGCPQTLMDAVTEFLAEERIRLRAAALQREHDLEAAPPCADQHPEGRPPAAASQTEQSHQHGQDFQRKIDPRAGATGRAGGTDSAVAAAWEALRALGLGDDQEDERGGGEGALTATPRQDLIVVASLIDKVPNLAGLARTCEVFRARALVMADMRVASEASFAAISVTAEKWMPLLEVKEPALLAWLANRRAEGYALVGLEQTAESCSLPQFQWPSKSVLVLGREKEGLPAELIQMLDHTVEIPQFGLIRSLNVHVSAAIAVYEYTRQGVASGRLPGR